MSVAAAVQTAPLQRTLFQLSFPLFLNSFVTFAIVLLDTMIISAHSPEAAAAVNIANQVLVIAFEFSAMLGVGGVILIAHSLGRGDVQQARRIAVITVTANSILGLMIGILLVLLGPWILHLLNTPAAIAREVLNYLHIVAAAMLFNGFMVAAISCLRGFGQSRTVLVLGLAASLLYICAEYVLILGLGPVPALGVTGSALGTFLMRLVATAALFFVLVRNLRINRDSLRKAAFLPTARRVFNLSFPSVSDNIAYGLYQLILLGLVTGFGVASVLARAYVMIVTAFLTMGIMAVSQGNEVLIGYQRGRGETGKVYRQALQAALFSAVSATGLALLFYLFSDGFVGLFTADRTVHELVSQLLLLTVFLQPGFAINAVLFHSLKAAGDVKWPAVISQIITWGFSLPLAWLLCSHMGYGVAGIWMAMILEETLKAFLMFRRWKAQGWVHQDIL